MDEYIAFDSHKRYTLAERDPVSRGEPRQQRIEHRRGAIRDYLSECPSGGSVAVEATGNWYWIVDEIEQAGQTARLVHPGKAKLMMGMINKTDKFRRVRANAPSSWLHHCESCRARPDAPFHGVPHHVEGVSRHTLHVIQHRRVRLDAPSFAEPFVPESGDTMLIP